MNADPGSSPLAFFADELKRLRGIAGTTQEQLAEAVNYAPSTVAAIETCRLIPSDAFAERADKVLNGGGLLVRAQRLVEQTSVVPWFRDRIEVERKCAEIWEYEPYLMPGLLQTEEYARIAVAAHIPQLSDGDIERAVALRMTRQEVLALEDVPPGTVHEDAARFWFIIDESVLYRVAGGPEIMRAQYERLLRVARRPNVTIQIIEAAESPTCAFGRAFTVLVSRQNSSVVYYEDIGNARYVRDRHEVNRLMLVFNHLRASALDHSRSAELIQGLVGK